MVYSVLHWRLGKMALVVAVVLPTVYIIREPLSDWYRSLTRLTHMGTPCRDHCHDTLILVLSAVAFADTPTGYGTSVQ